MKFGKEKGTPPLFFFYELDNKSSLSDAKAAQVKQDVIDIRMKKRGILLLERYSGDCIAGNLKTAFERWGEYAKQIVLVEQHAAARIIQRKFRNLKTSRMLKELREMSLNKESKRRFQITRVRKCLELEKKK